MAFLGGGSAEMHARSRDAHLSFLLVGWPAGIFLDHAAVLLLGSPAGCRGRRTDPDDFLRVAGDRGLVLKNLQIFLNFRHIKFLLYMYGVLNIDKKITNYTI